MALLKLAETELLMLVMLTLVVSSRQNLVRLNIGFVSQDFDGILEWFNNYPDAAIRLSRELVIKTALDMKVTRSVILSLKKYWEARLVPL